MELHVSFRSFVAGKRIPYENVSMKIDVEKYLFYLSVIYWNWHRKRKWLSKTLSNWFSFFSFHSLWKIFDLCLIFRINRNSKEAGWAELLPLLLLLLVGFCRFFSLLFVLREIIIVTPSTRRRWIFSNLRTCLRYTYKRQKSIITSKNTLDDIKSSGALHVDECQFVRAYYYW